MPCPHGLIGNYFLSSQLARRLLLQSKTNLAGVGLDIMITDMHGPPQISAVIVIAHRSDS